jgi:flagellar biosynthesis GTPase FlhF
MELKRILARDSRSANEKAIQLYGPEVLIISSQRVDQQTELIVAVDVRADGHSGLSDNASHGAASPLAQPTPKAAETATHATASEGAMQPNAADFVPFSKIFQSAHGFAPLEPEHVQDQVPAQVQPAPAVAMAAVPESAALTLGLNRPLSAPAQSPSPGADWASAQVPSKAQADLQAPAAFAVSAHEAQRSAHRVARHRVQHHIHAAHRRADAVVDGGDPPTVRAAAAVADHVHGVARILNDLEGLPELEGDPFHDRPHHRPTEKNRPVHHSPSPHFGPFGVHSPCVTSRDSIRVYSSGGM